MPQGEPADRSHGFTVDIELELDLEQVVIVVTSRIDRFKKRIFRLNQKYTPYFF